MQLALNMHYERVCATKHAPRGSLRVLERCHGLAQIFERGVGVLVKRLRVIHPQPERESMIICENTSRHGHRYA